MAQKGKGSKQREKKDPDNRRAHRRTQGGRSTESNKPEAGIARREQSTNLRTVSPFSLMRRFSEEMDRLFGDFGFGGRLASGFGHEFGRLADLEDSMWLPQVEAFERRKVHRTRRSAGSY